MKAGNEVSTAEYRKLMAESELERMLLADIFVAQLPLPQREFVFAPPRRWRSDFAWPEYRILVECEGGTFGEGRHTRGEGYARDLEKYNRAALDGWLVLRFDTQMIRDGRAIHTIQHALEDGAILHAVARTMEKVRTMP